MLKSWEDPGCKYTLAIFIVYLPNLLVWVAAQPLHENVGVKAVRRATQKLLDGVRVVLFHITHLLCTCSVCFIL